MIRRLCILILSPLALNAPPDSRLIIAPELSPQQCSLRFTLLLSVTGAEAIERIAQEVAAQESIHVLANTIHAPIHTSCEAQGIHVTLNIPLHQSMILMIDDNPNVRTLFERYLTGTLYRIVSAADGETAIRLAREMQPALILLDIMMPGLDGWEVLQNLKNHPLTESIPVLVCSVLDVAALCAHFGADGFLRKPPAQDEFTALVSHWLG
ncbi:MAG: response regulator [Chloroflexi bacterium]|uniref:response regulator n=1 Tax=Candidatus Flexifilum breve TaxID=3140694 RepID=UPI003137030C|nr:response regulator [Chloroflexota bacterium]